MRVTTTDVLRGFVGGVLATACMAGQSAVFRRWRRPEGEPAGPPPPRHYEKVGLRIAEVVLGEDRTLSVAERVRFGEVLHFAFGGAMGVVFVIATERLPVPRPLRGSVHGLSLWALAFAGYFPALGIHPGVWTWSRQEVVSTLRAHLTYGNSLMLITRGLAASADQRERDGGARPSP